MASPASLLQGRQKTGPVFVLGELLRASGKGGSFTWGKIGALERAQALSEDEMGVPREMRSIFLGYKKGGKEWQLKIQ